MSQGNFGTNKDQSTKPVTKPARQEEELDEDEELDQTESKVSKDQKPGRV